MFFFFLSFSVVANLICKNVVVESILTTVKAKKKNLFNTFEKNSTSAKFFFSQKNQNGSEEKVCLFNLHKFTKNGKNILK